MKLQTRIALASQALIILVLFSLGGLLLFVEKRHLLQTQLEQQNGAVEKLAQVCIESQAESNDLILLNYVLTLMKGSEVHSVAFLDPQGRVVVHSDVSLVGTVSNDEPTRALLASSQLLRQERSGNGVLIDDVGVPVRSQGRTIGFARIGYDRSYFQDQVDQTLNAAMVRFLYVSGVAMLLGFMGSVFFARGITRPVQTLVDATAKIGHGELTHRIDVERSDEIGHLAHSFNEMSRKLQELDEMKNDFVSSVSHELRSPLTALKGFLQMFQMGIGGSLTDQQKENVGVMLQCTDRLSRFVNNILDVAKLDAGMVEFNMERVRPAEIAAEIVTLFQAQAQTEKIHLTCEAQGSIPEVHCDADRLRQVFTNLISNAMKFTPEGGSVKVWLRDESAFVKMGVSDSGAGIPAEEIPKLFNKFEQVKKTRDKAKSKGTGLGLTIIKKIVSGFGGQIGVESSLGQGTTFYFTIPKHPAAQGRQIPRAA